MRHLSALAAVVLMVTAVSCRTPVLIDKSPPPASVSGTISGTVQTPGGASPLIGRTVTAIDTETGHRYDAKTNVSGGFSIKVPPGTYRLEVELESGERVLKAPETVRINKSDVDSSLVVIVGPA